MSEDVTLVLVNYRTAALAAEAVRTFRGAARAAGLGAGVVVVDHSEDGEERERLRGVADRLVAQDNRGYAAGLNAGIRAARGAVVLAGNPDLVFPPGAVGALAAALRAGWDVVGPQFEVAGFALPPADRQTPGEELARWLGGRVGACWAPSFRHELRRSIAVWQADRPCAQEMLSGALLAFPRAVFERIGAFDEGYFLYYEETDWLRRARHAGLRLALVPSVRVPHLWGQSADPVATARLQWRSRARYFRRHYPLWAPLVLRLGAAPAPPVPRLAGVPAVAGRWLWLLSPASAGMPAAGRVAEAADAAGRVADFAALHPSIPRYLLVAASEDGRRIHRRWAVEAGRA